MTAPLISLDGATTTRSIVFPDTLWERLASAAQALSVQTGIQVTMSDLVRQGAAQRAEAILGTREAA